MLHGAVIPRLNYKYSFHDACIGFRGMLARHIDLTKFSDRFGMRDVYFVNHGRTGLRMALTALDLPRGSRVGVSVFNCPTVFKAVLDAGHIPVFLDITNNFRLDLNNLESSRNNLDALIITHLFGIPNSIADIRKIVADMPVIEDCAHSFLSRENLCLTGKGGDIGVFSCGKGKFPSIGGGGIIHVNNKKYLDTIGKMVGRLHCRHFGSELLHILRNLILSLIHIPFIYGNFTYPLFKKGRTVVTGVPVKGTREARIFKSDLSILLSKMTVYEEAAVKQAENAGLNHKMILKPGKDVDFQLTDIDNAMNYFMLPVLVENRDQFIDRAYKNGIELGKHFSNSVIIAKEFGYTEGSCRNAEIISATILTIPTYYRIRVKDEGSD